jgi:hypothetical protein
LITQEDDAVLLTPTTLSAPKVTVEKFVSFSGFFYKISQL